MSSLPQLESVGSRDCNPFFEIHQSVCGVQAVKRAFIVVFASPLAAKRMLESIKSI
jgi:hypothetical protein